jgi:hypothetical protein
MSFTWAKIRQRLWMFIHGSLMFALPGIKTSLVMIVMRVFTKIWVLLLIHT